MRTVYKYPLVVTDEQQIMMVNGAQPLSVRKQNDMLCLWALVDPTQPAAAYRVRMAGTGHPIDDEWADWDTFIDTLVFNDGLLVFHFFVLRA
jgi:hypothetical protein